MNEARFTISLDENSIYRIVRWEGLKPILEIDPNKLDNQLDNHMQNVSKAEQDLIKLLQIYNKKLLY